MRPRCVGEGLHVRQRADVMPPFKGRLAIDDPFTVDPANSFQPFPFFGVGQGVQTGRQIAPPCFDTPMPHIRFLNGLQLAQARFVGGYGLLEIIDNGLMQMFLVAFHREDIIGLFFNDFFRYLGLTAHRVDRDDTAFNFE